MAVCVGGAVVAAVAAVVAAAAALAAAQSSSSLLLSSSSFFTLFCRIYDLCMLASSDPFFLVRYDIPFWSLRAQHKFVQFTNCH